MNAQDADLELLWLSAIEHAAAIEVSRLTWQVAKHWLARRAKEEAESNG